MSDLFPYQNDGVAFLKARKAALLADEPGLGKTVQAICAAEEIGAETILVICPKSAVGNWSREFRRWWPGGPTPRVVNFDIYSVRDPDNEEKLVGLLDVAWDLVVIDEAHRLKTPSTLRTKNIYGRVTPNAKNVWLLTGTPTPNHNGEIYTHIRALVPQYIPHPTRGGYLTAEEFEDRFCNVSVHPDYGRRILGNKDTQKLKELIAPFTLRRMKGDVLRDLPPLRFEHHPLDNWNKKMRDKVGQAEIPPEVREEDLIAWLRSNEVHIATERRLTGLVKVPGVVEVVSDLYDAGVTKQIVFAHHRDVLDSLQEKIKGLKGVRIDGSTPAKERDKAVDAFQNDPTVTLFYGQIAACGEALTLTAASDVLFAEYSWTPSDNYQAACRAHRIGQNNGVIARFLTLPGSIDEVIGRVMARKAREIAELFG